MRRRHFSLAHSCLRKELGLGWSNCQLTANLHKAENQTVLHFLNINSQPRRHKSTLQSEAERRKRSLWFTLQASLSVMLGVSKRNVTGLIVWADCLREDHWCRPLLDKVAKNLQRPFKNVSFFVVYRKPTKFTILCSFCHTSLKKYVRVVKCFSHQIVGSSHIKIQLLYFFSLTLWQDCLDDQDSVQQSLQQLQALEEQLKSQVDASSSASLRSDHLQLCHRLAALEHALHRQQEVLQVG